MEEESPVFSLEKVNEAINRSAAVFSDLELSMLEVIHVLKSLEGGLETMLGPDRYAECMIYYESTVHAGSGEQGSEGSGLDADVGSVD